MTIFPQKIGLLAEFLHAFSKLVTHIFTSFKDELNVILEDIAMRGQPDSLGERDLVDLDTRMSARLFDLNERILIEDALLVWTFYFLLHALCTEKVSAYEKD